RILAGHPRLALAPSDREPLARWLIDARVQVTTLAPRLLDELRVRLDGS
ncbi:MAG: hypothetical protein IAG13_25145, partial [Deltaproteobacteria bacterium]|nr:hypothetical protein [Nannocystaceae bacterium]